MYILYIRIQYRVRLRHAPDDDENPLLLLEATDFR